MAGYIHPTFAGTAPDCGFFKILNLDAQRLVHQVCT